VRLFRPYYSCKSELLKASVCQRNWRQFFIRRAFDGRLVIKLLHYQRWNWPYRTGRTAVAPRNAVCIAVTLLRESRGRHTLRRANAIVRGASTTSHVQCKDVKLSRRTHWKWLKAPKASRMPEGMDCEGNWVTEPLCKCARRAKLT